MKPTLNDTEAQLMSRLLDAEWALMHNRTDEALSQVREANRLAGLVCDAAANMRHAVAVTSRFVKAEKEEA